MKTFVVSDVHGHLDRLTRALVDAKYQPGQDRLIFLGDTIDAFTGTDAENLAMLDHIVELAREPGHVFIRGNHEEEMLKALDRKSSIVSPDLADALTEEHKGWLRQTVDIYNEGSFAFVHDSILHVLPGRTVIAGHWHHPVPIVKEACITVASSRKVFVMDLEAMIVYDSDGKKYDVAKK